jgi:hypothetical protein
MNMLDGFVIGQIIGGSSEENPKFGRIRLSVSESLVSQYSKTNTKLTVHQPRQP